MNGPTPIISSMLKATAERRPMRRWRVLAELELGKFMRLLRSPDCTLTGDMIRFEKVQRAVTCAVLAGLMLAGTHRATAAREDAAIRAGRRRLCGNSSSGAERDCFALARRSRRGGSGTIVAAARNHRQRDDDCGASGRRGRRAADLSEPRTGRASHAADAESRRRRAERHVGRRRTMRWESSAPMNC